MPVERTKRSWIVTTFWVFLFALILVATGSLLIAIVYREEGKEISNAWGNYASVLGLWFGLIAFLLTILTLLLTAQAEEEAARKAQAAAEQAELAVRDAEQRTASLVERLGMQLLETSCDALGRSVKRIQEIVGRAMSAQEEPQWRQLWQEIAQRCRECSESVGDLLANPRLNPDEREAVTQEMSGISQIAAFIERNRLPAEKNGKLGDAHTTTLDRLFALLTNIRHRVRRQVYEVSDANRQ